MDREVTVPGIGERLRRGFASGWETSWKLVKVTVPLYAAMDLLKRTPVIDLLGSAFAPLMGPLGLPGEAGLAFMAAFLLNLYAAIAVIVPLDLTPWQVTQCGLMMGIAHNLVVEGAVLRSTGTRGGVLTAGRLAVAALAGLLHNAARLLAG